MGWGSIISAVFGGIGLISSLFGGKQKRDTSALDKMHAEAAKKKQDETDKLAGLQQRGRRSRKRRSVLSEGEGQELQATLG